MKKIFAFAVFLQIFFPVFSQSRDDIRIFIPNVMSSDPAQAKFFKDNFEMETRAAGYSLTDNVHEADYELHMEVQPNMILYDDGTIEAAPKEEGLYLLQINLVRSEDHVEIVAFSFSFTEVEEMYDYNLYLLYEAMANVPMTKPGTGMAEFLPDTSWRNKWLYFRGSFDYPVTFYGLKEPEFLTYTSDYPDDSPPRPLDNVIRPWIAATVGFEFQYLNWMSTELCFNLSFSDPMSSAFIPSLQLEQKFPIKPSAYTHFMIEPYLVISFPMNTSPNVLNFPLFGVGGGFQFAAKAGKSGGFFVDFNFIYFLDDVVMAQTDTRYVETQETYFRFVVGLGIGYKYGIIDRPARGQHNSLRRSLSSSAAPPQPAAPDNSADSNEPVDTSKPGKIEEYETIDPDQDEWWY